MKRILSFILTVFVATTVIAATDDAKTILDQASKTYEAAGDVKIGFRFNSVQGQTMGYIELSGKKFHCDLGGTKTWFDGQTMWNYVEANHEVTITTPSSAQASRMNPYSFITMYRNGYTCKMGKSTKSYHEVILMGDGKTTAYKQVLIRFDKATHQPLYIKTITKNEVEITVNSFVKNQKFPASNFTFDKSRFKGVDINDLR